MMFFCLTFGTQCLISLFQISLQTNNLNFKDTETPVLIWQCARLLSINCLSYLPVCIDVLLQELYSQQGALVLHENLVMHLVLSYCLNRFMLIRPFAVYIELGVLDGLYTNMYTCPDLLPQAFQVRKLVFSKRKVKLFQCKCRYVA